MGAVGTRRPHPTALELLVGFEMGLYARDDVGAWVNVEVERRDGNRSRDPRRGPRVYAASLAVRSHC
jgi:hypothetical protein